MDLEKFISVLFKNLIDKRVFFCVLRNHEGLPYHNFGNDIDILIKLSDKNVVKNLLGGIKDVKVTGYIERSYVFSYFIYGINLDNNKNALQIDFVTSLSWKGLSYLNVDQVLVTAQKNRTPSVEIPVPSMEIEALVSFFSSYLVGGWINEKYQARVQRIFSDKRTEIFQLLGPVFGKAVVDEMLTAVVTDNRKRALEVLARLRRGLIVRSFLHYPLRSLIHMICHYTREAIIHFTHKFIYSVCILGPDGAGKSTVIEKARHYLINTSKDIDVHHHKPKIFWRSDSQGLVRNPHEKGSRGKFLSCMKISAWALELWIDYFGHGKRNLTLRIWDRYYHDLLVDPLRYRYGGPMWLARWIGKLIPKPGLWIFLDAPAEVLQARKQEVSFDETARQRSAYMDLALGLNNSVVVDASQPLDKVVSDVNSSILTFMAERTRKRIGRSSNR